MFHVRLRNALLLLTYLILVIESVDPQFCKPRMTYHNLTHTCMTVVNEKRKHYEANEYCEKHFSGHLVYILDGKTNTFTKYLLPTNEWYHIGLTDRDQNGVYKWGNRWVANFTDFKFRHRPNEMKMYVTMYRGFWNESYDSELKFICQTPAENELFLLNGSNFVHQTLVTTAQRKVVWYCRVFDREKHSLELLYRKIDGTILHLWNVNGTDLKHETTPDCYSSGVYICQITNRLSGNIVNLEGILKVRCDATNCSDKDTNIKLLVADHLGCTEEGTKVPVLKSKYNIGFTYTNENYTKGELVITFCNATSSDYGGYAISLWNNVNSLSTLYFNIAVN